MISQSVGRVGVSHPEGNTEFKVIRGGLSKGGINKGGAFRNNSFNGLHKVTAVDLIREVLRDGIPRMHQPKYARKFHFKNLPNLMRGMKTILAASALKLPMHLGDLRLKVIRNSDGAELDLGLVSLRVVTDNGVALMVDTFDNTVANGDCRYHGIGTGTNAENATDSALQAELTTAYNPDNTRATGTFSQPSANQSRSVATNTVDSGVSITEHGPFTQAATGGGTLLDRSQFTAVALANGDSLQSTYTLTLTSGG